MGAKTYSNVIELYKNGKDAAEIAEALHKSRGIVHRHLRTGQRKGDIQIRSNESMHLAFRIVRDLKAGVSQSEIAQQHRISRQFVFLVKKMAEKENIL